MCLSVILWIAFKPVLKVLLTLIFLNTADFFLALLHNDLCCLCRYDICVYVVSHFQQAPCDQSLLQRP